MFVHLIIMYIYNVTHACAEGCCSECILQKKDCFQLWLKELSIFNIGFKLTALCIWMLDTSPLQL